MKSAGRIPAIGKPKSSTAPDYTDSAYTARERKVYPSSGSKTVYFSLSCALLNMPNFQQKLRRDKQRADAAVGRDKAIMVLRLRNSPGVVMTR